MIFSQKDAHIVPNFGTLNTQPFPLSSHKRVLAESELISQAPKDNPPTYNT